MKKTASFAVVHFSVAFSVGYALTGSIAVGSAVALIEPMVNTVAFYFHEKIWNRFEQNDSTPTTIGENSQTPYAYDYAAVGCEEQAA